MEAAVGLHGLAVITSDIRTTDDQKARSFASVRPILDLANTGASSESSGPALERVDELGDHPPR